MKPATPPEPERQTLGEHMDSELDGMHEEIAALRQALRVEQARSELLWEMARRRGYVTEEEASVARIRVA
jgi:hypothetical protein